MERTALVYRQKYKTMQLSMELIVHDKELREKGMQKQGE
jgi:hypothetical protein